HGITREKLVVLGGAQEAHNAPLNHQVVDDLLGLRLRQRTLAQVSLEVTAPECGESPGRHGRTVLLLDRSKIPEVGPLHRFACVAGWTRDVVAVTGCHLL